MICAQHNWWNADPCPNCAPVTVAETCETITNGGDYPLDIPPFLKRNKDGSFQNPACAGHVPLESGSPSSRAPGDIAGTPMGDVRPHTDWADEELFTALSSTDYSLVERQPIYMELRAREDRKKSLARIAEMKAKKAAKVS